MVAQMNMVTEVTVLTKVTMTTKAAGRFAIQSFPRVENRVVLHVRCTLLSDFKQNLNMSTHFSRTLQYKFLESCVRTYDGAI